MGDVEYEILLRSEKKLRRGFFSPIKDRFVKKMSDENEIKQYWQNNSLYVN